MVKVCWAWVVSMEADEAVAVVGEDPVVEAMVVLEAVVGEAAVSAALAVAVVSVVEQAKADDALKLGKVDRHQVVAVVALVRV